MILFTCGDVPVEGCYATIQDAVDAAADGDEIQLVDGRYVGGVTLVDRDLAITGVGEVILTDPVDGADVFTVEGGSLTLSAVTVATVRGRLIDARDAVVELNDVNAASTGYQVAGGLIRARGGTLSLTYCAFRGGAAESGGLVWAEDADVSLVGTILRDGVADYEGGALWVDGASRPVRLELTGSEFLGNEASSGGGALWAGDATVDMDVGVFGANTASQGGGATLYDCDTSVWLTIFEANTAGGSGGGGLYVDGGAVVIDGATFDGNSAAYGGGLYVRRGALELVDVALLRNEASGPGAAFGVIGAVDARRLWVCGNVAGQGSVISYGNDTVTRASRIANSLFLTNTGLGSGALIEVSENAGNAEATFAFTDNHVVGNTTLDGLLVALGTFGYVSSELSGDLFALNTATTYNATKPNVDLGIDRNSASHLLFWGNAGVSPDGLEGTVVGDPLLLHWDAGRACDRFGMVGWHGWSGAARDAGRPDALDPDRSRADIGAYGGAGAAMWEHPWEDSDGDGWVNLYDCDLNATEIHPESVDLPYDGIDTDCDGWSDYDADRDGADAQPWGDDCDDADPGRAPGLTEVPYDGIDQDCSGLDADDLDGDGFPGDLDCDDDDAAVRPGLVDGDPTKDRDCDGIVDVVKPLRPRSCATSPGGAGLVLVLLALRTRRRREGGERWSTWWCMRSGRGRAGS